MIDSGFGDGAGGIDGVFVKICGITSEADALLAVGMGATAVGFGPDTVTSEAL